MSSLALNIGKSALQAQSAALEVIGQNMSNATTEGYSRKSVSSSGTSSTKNGNYSTGTGVEINGVSRIVSSYYQECVRECTSNFNYAEESNSVYTSIESGFGELTDSDISSGLTDFWSALNTLSADPTNTELAITTIQQANTLVSSINDLDESLKNIHADLNTKIQDDVNSINSLTQEIADLNKEIMSTEACGANGVEASDLRDQRDQFVKELNGICDITVIEDDNGSLSIYNDNNLLVYKDETYEVGVKTETIDGVRYNQPVFTDGNVAIESESGSLGASLNLRDDVVPSYQNDLDTLSANIISQFNHVYSQGIGNSGYTDITGSTKIENPQATLNNLDYGVNTIEDTYEISNGSFELVVYNTETNSESTVVIDIDLDGNSSSKDTILYDEDDPTAENSLVNIIQSKLNDKVPGVYSVSLNNDNQLVIDSDSDIYELGFGKDTSGAVSALGLNNLFTGFTAEDIAVNEDLVDNPELFATGNSFTSDNNETINSLIELRDESVMSDNTQTIEEYYTTIVGRLGVEAEAASNNYEMKESLLLQSETNNENVSGVSLDEEIISLYSYQKAYQAAAEFITVIDECMQTILDM